MSIVRATALLVAILAGGARAQDCTIAAYLDPGGSISDGEPNYN